MLPALGNNSISARQRFDGFLASPVYIGCLALLTLLANIFSLELALYGLFAAIVVYCCVAGNDLLPMMPIFIFSYIAPSVQNNPGRNPNSTFSGAGGICILAIAGVIAVSVIFYVIRNRKRFGERKYTLLSSMLILTAAYLLGGIGCKGYGDLVGKHLVFALLQGLSILVPYCLFVGGVNWEKTRKDYFGWLGFCAGWVLFLEIVFIYCSAGVVIDGIIHRDQIYTGWGIHNNLGGMLAMMIPFSFYLATRYHKGWLGTVCGSVFLIGVLLSCSRNAILVGSAMYLACVILMLFYAHDRKTTTITVVAFGSVALVLFSLFYQPLLQLFSDLLDLGFDPNSRDSIYADGMRLFARYPIFGGSFFSTEFVPWDWSTVSKFSGFFAPRWHNTIVQMLASCGIVGLVAYLFHRVQTTKLFAKKLTQETTFIGGSIIALLICSLFDCHFFNIGPTLFYAMALAFAEQHKNT